METVHLFISGKVQGIGYRQFIKSFARKNSVFGWVQNLPDGRVEVVLQGSRSLRFHADDESSSERAGQAKEAIEKMIELCRKGPFLAEVKEITVGNEDTNERFSDFTIR